mmetsp:Transcript_59705/g.176919  ORF Transcript_59705/g.176919 Transcript_59705/m.176919 type:complete len:361 (+) Transcript_59705:1442-2524(+)
MVSSTVVMMPLARQMTMAMLAGVTIRWWIISAMAAIRTIVTIAAIWISIRRMVVMMRSAAMVTMVAPLMASSSSTAAASSGPAMPSVAKCAIVPIAPLLLHVLDAVAGLSTTAPPSVLAARGGHWLTPSVGAVTRWARWTCGVAIVNGWALASPMHRRHPVAIALVRRRRRRRVLPVPRIHLPLAHGRPPPALLRGHFVRLGCQLKSTTGNLLPLSLHHPEELLVDLAPQQRAIHVPHLLHAPQLERPHQSPQILLIARVPICPSVERLQCRHPLVGGELGHRREVIAHRAHLVPKERADGRKGGLDIDAIPLELLDASREEFVVVDERPKVSPPLVVRGRFDPRVLARFGLPPGSRGLP